MIKNDIISHLKITLVLILVTLNITKVVDLFGIAKFNIALSDYFLPIILVLVYFFKQRGSLYFKVRYRNLWLLLFVWIITTGLFALNSVQIETLSWFNTVEEVIKTMICIVYFIVGYNTLVYLNENHFRKIWMISTVIFIIGGFIIYYLANSGIYLWSNDLKYARMFMGTDSDPNHAAMYLTLSFYAMAIFIYTASTKKDRLIYAMMAIVSVFGVVFTGSRGGIIGLLVGLAILLILIGIKNPRVLMLIVIVSVIMLFTFAAGDQFLFESKTTQRILYKFENFEEGLSVRWSLSKVAFLMGKDHFLFGVGRGNFILNSPSYFQKIGNKYIEDIPHNTYFGLFAEVGLIGTLLFLMPVFILIYKIICGYINNINSKSDNFVLTILLTGIVSVAIQAFVLNVENRRFLWYLSGILIFALDNTKFGITYIIPHELKKIRTRILLILMVITFLYYGLLSNILSIPQSWKTVTSNYEYKLPNYATIKNQSNSVSVDMYFDQNQTKSNRLRIQIVQLSKDNSESILLTNELDGASGPFIFTFTPTATMKDIFLKANIIDDDLNSFRIRINYSISDNKVYDLNKWYYLLPPFINDFKIKADSKDFELWEKDTDLTMGDSKSFENAFKLINVEVNQLNDDTNEVILKYYVESVRAGYVPFLNGYPMDSQILDKTKIAFGYESYSLINHVNTDSWKKGKEYEVSFIVPRNYGLYNLRTGFLSSNQDVISTLYTKNVNQTVGSLLDLGWLNLNENTKGEINE